jgi:hypothetical protein
MAWNGGVQAVDAAIVDDLPRTEIAILPQRLAGAEVKVYFDLSYYLR